MGCNVYGHGIKKFNFAKQFLSQENRYVFKEARTGKLQELQ